MSHRHYCDVDGHEWRCTDAACECICAFLMEQGDHSECPVELRACPEHQDVQLPASSNSELSPNYFKAAAHGAAERPNCECGCSDTKPEEIVGSCVWCGHVYVSFDAVTQARHFSNFCAGAPGELREASRLKLARLTLKREANGTMSKPVTPESHVGIFWLFRDRLILDATPLSMAEPYGTALTHPISHIDHWTRLQRNRAVPAELEYEESPRGRVVFDRREERFHLYADKCILGRRDVIAAIMNAMNLPPDKTSEGRDEHYRCFDCLYPAAADEDDF